MKSINTIILTASVLVLAGCNSDPTTPEPTPDDNQQTVTVAACPVGKRALLAADDACIDSVDDGTPVNLPPGNRSSATLAAGRTRLYQITSDAQISLVSNSGNANLFLYDKLEDIDYQDPTDDFNLCASGYGFREDTCTANDPYGEMYALVVAKTDADYTISSTMDCSVPAINEWVYRHMNDYYLYADQVPVVNPSVYATTEELLAELKFQELEPFSSIRNAATQSDFSNLGLDYNFGYIAKFDGDRNFRVALVYPDSSFALAGVKRGDIIVSINGEPENGMTSARYFELIRSEDMLTLDWQFIDGDTGVLKTLSITKGEYNVDSVVQAKTFINSNTNDVAGYLLFNAFIAPSEDELDSAINFFNERGVNELILDLRYNGGGRTRIAQRLASQIGGPELAGETHTQVQFNSKYSQFNYDEFLFNATPALDVNRVIILTTGWTASSSEIVINSLSPYMDVITIGDTTLGKPFISSGQDFCGKTLNAMMAQHVNSVGVSVAGGIPPSCYAADDLSNDFGINDAGITEGMLGKAFDYLTLGTCDAQPFAKSHLPASHGRTDKGGFDESATH